MKIRKALVTGVTGQDGAYLSKILLKKNYKVYGTYRRTSTPNFWRLQNLEIYSKIQLVPADLLDMGSSDMIGISTPTIFLPHFFGFLSAAFSINLLFRLKNCSRVFPLVEAP